ncbi:hypothetical protein G6O69_32175 [Pseudenhygromyxa sp. WMMC2535]|uniref:YkvA family protein n=1 Tax=Pseudenhygromyxa sp. WMMC2535 TaxID=2712867 RepID=UPI00155494E4|nr:hypothetical protein [Pseudenhygromyxa sp. WMMC2535]NVB42525.1 hypothetical protein [Pseudenhygromyxa sp. WMMC2535]
MDTANLLQLIETAVAIEAKEGHLAHYLAERAQSKGASFGDEQRVEALELFEGYVRSVPKLLASALTSSVGTPVEALMAKVVRAAAAYWDEPDDLVPDSLGILGLLDDAYYSLRMLQLVSERLQAESGQALIAEDLSALDAVVRDILGEVADALDDLVILSLSNTPVDELIATLDEHAGSFRLASAETSFTGMSVEALVSERLSFAQPEDGALVDEIGEVLEALGRSLAEGFAAAGGFDLRAAVRGGSEALELVLRRAILSEGASDEAAEEIDEADLALAVSLLVGAVVQRAALGEAVDRELVVDCVQIVLEGVS